MVRTITVEREYGAGGGVIARKLAQRLGWKLWDAELTCEIARLAKVDQAAVERMDERCDPLFYRLMKVFMRGSMEQSVAVHGMGHFDADSMVEFMQRVISGAASEGNSVIVGRGAPFLLRGRPDTFHVFIYAPFEEKIRRLTQWIETQGWGESAEIYAYGNSRGDRRMLRGADHAYDVGKLGPFGSLRSYPRLRATNDA